MLSSTLLLRIFALYKPGAYCPEHFHFLTHHDNLSIMKLQLRTQRAPIPIIALHTVSVSAPDCWFLQHRLNPDVPGGGIATGRRVSLFHSLASFRAKKPQPALTGYIQWIIHWDQQNVKFTAKDSTNNSFALSVPIEDCSLGVLASLARFFASPFLSSPTPPRVSFRRRDSSTAQQYREVVRDSDDLVIYEDARSRRPMIQFLGPSW
ncbi:hypothetical protein BJ138DRAFT_1151783 [Hygrophoropsis aurantiaca]|uniref:Uncharacterized protein n=1 Tax=Hygrophoropsis aurantiaca TaxID=72124 RepID=A0ACB8AD14_9AGAM|nr:hypothetical protein BJ138DRAFT_1151783 [Hygrophoropsis aurantiaca]